MTLVKYDVANVGPDDLAAGLDFLQDIKKKTGLMIISSNIVAAKTSAPIFATSVVKTVDGVKVGFFGIAGGSVSGAHDRETFTFADPESTGKKMVAELSKKATFVVALLAMDRKEAYDFAAAVSGIDIIITTSEPQPIPIPILAGTAYIASGDEKGKRLGRATIVVGARRPFKITGEIVPIGSLINRDPALNKLENDYYEWLKQHSPNSAGEPPDTMDE